MRTGPEDIEFTTDEPASNQTTTTQPQSPHAECDASPNSAPLVADGGLTIREFEEINPFTELIRSYRTHPRKHLYAYRSENDEHHIVVARGKAPRHRWETRIPANVLQPDPEGIRWTIPDNWEKKVYADTNSGPQAIYYIQSQGVWVRVSIPTTETLSNAWYGIEAAGDLTVDLAADIGTCYEVKQLAATLDESDRYTDDHATALRELADHWEVIESARRNSTQWVKQTWLHEMEFEDHAIHTNEDWTIDFPRETIFRADKAIRDVIDYTEYAITRGDLLTHLQDAELLPRSHTFKLGIDTSDYEQRFYGSVLLST